MIDCLRPIVCAVLFTGVAVFGTSSSAESIQPFGAEKPVSLEDLRPTLFDDEWYNESWSHNVHLPDGGFIAVDFRISNIAMTSDHDGVFQARFVQPDGKKTKCNRELDDDEWTYAKTGFALDFRSGQVRADEKGLNVSVDCKNLAMKLRFENVVPAYQPGGGTLRFGASGIYQKAYHSPRSRVTGTVTIAGKTREIAGAGVATHSLYNMRPDRQVHRWFRFKDVRKDYSVIAIEMEATKDFDRARNGWVMILDNEKRIMATTRVRFEYDGFIRDERHEGGYKIPRRVRLAARDGDSQLTGVIMMKSIEKSKDFTEKLDAVSRAIVRRYTKPREYHVACTYDFKVKTGEHERRFKGDHKFRYMYINP